MADKPTHAEGKSNAFEQFLKDAPSANEVLGTGVVTLTGVVLRSEKTGMFVLASTDGQTLELPVEAVQRHEVVQDTPPQRMVRLEVAADRIPAEAIQKSPATDAGVFKQPWHDHHTIKESITDPIVDWKRPWVDWHTHAWHDQIPKIPQLDPIPTLAEGIDPGTLAEGIGQPGGEVTNPAIGMAAGLAPFVMATPHHAPQAAVAMQSMAGLHQTHPHVDRTMKEVIKDPFFDGKLPWFDWPHTHPVLDNLQTNPRADSPFTLAETIGGDPTNTLQEGVGVDVPGGGVVNPAAGLAANMAMAMRGGISPAGLQSALRTIPGIDQIHTIWYFDNHHTIKEIAKDPIWDVQTSPAYDGPYTWVEGVGGDPTNSLQEGIGVGNQGGLVTNPAVWNLPGLMF